MSKKIYTLFAIFIMVAMLLSACQPAAPDTPDFLACQVTDVGGIDDRSFNATAWKGVQDAMAELDIDGRVLESRDQADYERNINALVEEGCDIIITVGFLLGDATAEAAALNPDQSFAIVDFAYDPTINNVLGLVFATEEAAFLAGYAAASVTQTGSVGTFGGIQIPPVTVFMDGFAMGVQYYNDQKGANVQVLGWDPNTQTGLFTGNFDSLDDGRTMGELLMGEGADIIMPVAGPVGLGTAAAARERGNVYIIGVDTDWTVSSPEYTDITFTSVLKNMDVAVFEAIKAELEGTFQGGVFVGTLANNGVGIAPFHQLDAMVSAETKAELDGIKQLIIDGQVQVMP
jgi:basic membrane protein A and related proteins